MRSWLILWPVWTICTQAGLLVGLLLGIAAALVSFVTLSITVAILSGFLPETYFRSFVTQVVMVCGMAVIGLGIAGLCLGLGQKAGLALAVNHAGTPRFRLLEHGIRWPLATATGAVIGGVVAIVSAGIGAALFASSAAENGIFGWLQNLLVPTGIMVGVGIGQVRLIRPLASGTRGWLVASFLGGMVWTYLNFPHAWHPLNWLSVYQQVGVAQGYLGIAVGVFVSTSLQSLVLLRNTQR